jgi:predicted HicB family RNase H-like nuclease
MLGLRISDQEAQLATFHNPAKRRGRRARAKVSPHPAPKPLRERSLHFRISDTVAQALQRAAEAERRSVSAWVAICVEDRLRSGGYFS